jgi:hypothetical protein
LSSFERQQLKHLIDQLPDDKLDDTIKTVTEILEQPDYVKYYNGIPILDGNNELELKRLMEMIDKSRHATPAMPSRLKLVHKK